MTEYKVQKNDAGQRLDRYLAKAFPAIPSSLRYKLIRKKRIKLNKKRCFPNDILKSGDILTFYLSDELLKSPKKSTVTSDLPIDMIYEDENILAIDKPCGLKSQPDFAGEDSVVSRVRGYLISSGKYSPDAERCFTPSLCNRLDRNTRGLILVAKNAEALRILNEKIKNRELKKYYTCWVSGIPQYEHTLLSGWWEKDSAQNKVFISPDYKPGRKAVKTEYWLKKSDKTQSLLKVLLHTGRSHQIRAHLASMGHPLVGDKKYGGSGVPPAPLTACAVTFDFKTHAGELEYLNKTTISLDKKSSADLNANS